MMGDRMRRLGNVHFLLFCIAFFLTCSFTLVIAGRSACSCTTNRHQLQGTCISFVCACHLALVWLLSSMVWGKSRSENSSTVTLVWIGGVGCRVLIANH